MTTTAHPPGAPGTVGPVLGYGRSRRLAVRWPVLLALVLSLPVVVVALVGTLDWPGRVFPGFFVLGNRLVPTVGLYSWTGIRAGVPFHARVVSVDDRAVGTSADVYAAVDGRAVGTPVRYTLQKGGEAFTVTVPTMRFGAVDYWLTVGLMAFFGVLSIGVGVIVGILQPRTAAARAFLVQGILTGLFALTGTALYSPRLWWMIYPHILTQAAFPAAFIHLGLVFPVERRFVTRRPVWLGLPYAVALVLTVWIALAFLAEPPDPTPLYVAYLYSAASILVLLGLTAYSYVECRTPEVRPQLHSVLPGLAFGTVLGLYGFVNTARGGGDFPINLIALTPLLFYLSVGYAIARHDLFDIDTLLKQALVYGTLTLAITGAYAGTVALLSSLHIPAIPERGPAVTIAFVVLVAVAIQPVRAALQGVADRVFSRGRLDYRRTVGEVSAALTSLLDLDEILDQVGRTVTEGLQLRGMTVLLWIGGATRVVRWDHGARHMGDIHGLVVEAIRRRLEVEPRGVQMPLMGRDDDTDFVREADALGAALILPLALGGEVVGAFVLGRPRSGRLFSRQDVDLLRTLAAQSAIAIGNAASYRALRAANEELEAKVQARTAALAASHRELTQAYRDLQSAQAQLVHGEKMASLGVLVAGVAHEINNPVSFIVGGIEPLRGIVGELREFITRHPDVALEAAVERAGRAVEAIARGAERTAGIVKDLRTFSRSGESRALPVDIHEGLEVSLRLLQPRWVNRITIHREFGILPLVEGAPDELNQVWMNLLANACDAIADHGNIWIRTRVETNAISVAVRDDGGGIHPEEVPRIFDPFFTTKQPGKGTGLGLAVTHGIVTRHGGRITVTSTPGVGTEFAVVIPWQVSRAAGVGGPRRDS